MAFQVKYNDGLDVIERKVEAELVSEGPYFLAFFDQGKEGAENDIKFMLPFNTVKSVEKI